jgi:4'-phosphopantetheinyl transferase
VKTRTPLPSAPRPDARPALAAWTEPPARPLASAREAHVWLLEIPQLAPVLRDRLPVLLDLAERERAARLRFAADRERFGVCRAAARIVLGRYLRRPPESLRFGEGRHGKPRLLGGQRPPLEFNLAHSGDLGLLAVASGRAVGVDVERIDASRSGDDVARRFFAADEVERLDALPPGERVDAFFWCWTRKEAYLKARGDGLALPLASFSVAFGNGAGPAIVRSTLGGKEAARWKLFDLPPLPGYAAAVAVEDADIRLSFWRLSSDLVVGD